MHNKIYKLTAILVICMVGQSGFAITPDERITQHIAWLKSLRSDVSPTALSKIKKEHIKVWKSIYKTKALYRPVIIAQLNKQIQLKKPSLIVLLDLGSFLAFMRKSDDFQLVHKILQKLDIKVPMISNFSSLYYNMVFALADAGLEESLPTLDRILLPNSTNAYSAKSTPNAYRVHSFGVFGVKAVPYLLTQLKSSKNKKRSETILGVLRDICTRQCNQTIYNHIKNGVNHQTLSHAGFALLDLGGPEGRDLFLKLDPSKFSVKSSAWLKKEASYAKKLSYSRYLKKFESEHTKSTIKYTDKELLIVMKKMIVNPMLFIRSSHPHDFTNSTLEKKILVGSVLKMRRKLFRAINIHGGEYVDQANQLINALYYK